LITEIKRHKLGVLAATILALSAVAALGLRSVTGFSGISNVPTSEKSPSGTLKMQPLTAKRKYLGSGDLARWEKLLAYYPSVNGRAGVWTKQISTNSNIPIVEPTSFDYFAHASFLPMANTFTTD
jgi:hypothetical protein